LTCQPAQIINSSGLSGSLKIGSAADITIFDPNARWTVDPDRFASRGKNTPLVGMTLRGKVMMTIAAGKLAASNNLSWDPDPEPPTVSHPRSPRQPHQDML
jgi:dihydroorotase-like cyclic amidohydrolase